jgi:serine/threonine protein kinase
MIKLNASNKILNSRFEIVRDIGKYSFEAREISIDLKVFIKFCSSDNKTHQAEFLERGKSMAEEAFLPDIASVYECFPAQDSFPPYVIREYVEGQSTEIYLKEKNCDSADKKLIKSLEIILEVLNVLRDLKIRGIPCEHEPKLSNIFISNIDGKLKYTDLWLTEKSPFSEQSLPIIIGELLKQSFDSECFREADEETRRTISKIQENGYKITEDEITEILEKKKQLRQNQKYSPISLNPIKSALKKTVQESLQSFIDILYQNIPYNMASKLQRDKFSYATILMRKSKTYENTRIMTDEFALTFSAQYNQRLCNASSDLEEDSLKSILVGECSSGLPICWYEEDLEKKDREFLYFQVDETYFIQYMSVINLQDAIKPGRSEIISKRYKSWDSEELGWKLKTKAGKCMNEHATKTVQTQIVLPIYSSYRQKPYGDSDSIIGVINFEWEQQFTLDDAKALGNTLIQIMKNEKFFPNEFVCDLLSIIPGNSLDKSFPNFEVAAA